MSPSRGPGLEGYARGDVSFAAGLRPQDAIAMPLRAALEVLAQRFGSAAVAAALSDEAVDLERPLTVFPGVSIQVRLSR